MWRMIVLWGILNGCTTLVPPPAEVYEAQLQQNPEALWGKVLSRYDQGWVNFAGLRAAPADLNRYVAFIAHYSPKTHPNMFATLNERLAFYLNSYQALVLYGMLVGGMPQTLDGYFKRMSFFKLRTYTIGGEQRTLSSYLDEDLRSLGDPRIHFAISYLTASSPTLASKPFTAKFVEAQLDAAAYQFINSEKHLKVMHEKKTVYASSLFDFFSEDFVGERSAKTLVAYFNRYYQGAKIPENYRVEFMPFDWGILREMPVRR